MSRFSLPADTTPEAWRVLFESARRLTADEKWRQVDELNRSARELLAAGVRSRHPEYDEAQVHQAMIRLWLGDELYRCVYPGQDVAV